MKTVGLIGGMSWESSLEYYRIINQEVKRQLGGLHSAKSILYSVDFAEIEEMQSNGDWNHAGEELAKAALALERAGAEILIICTNTMHKLIDQIQSKCQLPLLHIADATAAVIKKDNLQKIALLGTTFTMEQDFYRQRLSVLHGLEVLIPHTEEREIIHNVIYQELCQGVVKPESKAAYLEIIHNLHNRGADGVILGCTEIELLITTSDVPQLKIYPTTKIHAQAAVNLALGKNPV